MRTLCNGVVYDTDTAKLICGKGHEWSHAGWHLYQTPKGAFFKVIYGYEGEEIAFSSIDYRTAYKLQESFPHHTPCQILKTPRCRDIGAQIYAATKFRRVRPLFCKEDPIEQAQWSAKSIPETIGNALKKR